MKPKKLINCEKQTTLQKIKESYAENSMLVKFYIWLSRKSKKNVERRFKE